MLELKSPLFAQIEITSRCNNKCGYCYNYWEKNLEIDSNLNEIFSAIDDLSVNEVKSIIITGGEPFCNPFLIDILKHCDENNIITLINTNGRLINDEYIKELKKIRLLSSINISLNSLNHKIHDSTTNVQGSWNDTIDSLNLCIKNRLKVLVNLTLTHFTANEIYDLAKYIHNLNATFGFTRFIPYKKELQYLNLTKNDVVIVKKQLDRLKKENIRVKIHTPFPVCTFGEKYDSPICTGGFSWCVISPDLNVRPCIFFDKPYGNLKNESIKNIWESMSILRNNFVTPEICTKCEKYNSCRGGCRKAAQINGDINGLDPLIDLNGKNCFNKSTDSFDSDYYKILQYKTVLRLKYDYQIRKENFGYVILFGFYPTFIKGEVSFSILKLINGQNSVIEIINKIKNQYEQYNTSVESDVLNFIYSLYKRNLLELRGA